MASRHYARHSEDLTERLRIAIGTDRLRNLHRRSLGLHIALGLLQTLLFCSLAFLIYRYDAPLVWLPLALLQGFVILSFIILLHEVIHGLVADGPRKGWTKWLGRYYAIFSGISASQFDRWHNDHHRELGSDDEDPKRAWLSPKKNARWLKALYFTPVLFLIYARAAGREAKRYEPELRRTIAMERIFTIAIHSSVLYFLVHQFDWAVALRVQLIPLFAFFPIAFALNRLGQHYDIKPDQVSAWSTRVDGNLLWRFLFLSSNHHIEHHYYPGVPLYRLPALNRALRPFFESEGIRNRGYFGLLIDWLIGNRPPHRDWTQTK